MSVSERGRTIFIGADVSYWIGIARVLRTQTDGIAQDTWGRDDSYFESDRWCFARRTGETDWTRCCLNPYPSADIDFLSYSLSSSSSFLLIHALCIAIFLSLPLSLLKLTEEIFTFLSELSKHVHTRQNFSLSRDSRRSSNNFLKNVQVFRYIGILYFKLLAY